MILFLPFNQDARWKKYFSPDELQDLDNLEVPDHGKSILTKLQIMTLVGCYSGMALLPLSHHYLMSFIEVDPPDTLFVWRMSPIYLAIPGFFIFGYVTEYFLDRWLQKSLSRDEIRAVILATREEYPAIWAIQSVREWSVNIIFLIVGGILGTIASITFHHAFIRVRPGVVEFSHLSSFKVHRKSLRDIKCIIFNRGDDTKEPTLIFEDGKTFDLGGWTDEREVNEILIKVIQKDRDILIVEGNHHECRAHDNSANLRS